MPLFSERERGPKPRTTEEISQGVWDGILAVIRTRLDDGSFGLSYPETCGDGNAICGVNERSFEAAIVGYNLPSPLKRSDVRDAFAVLDLVEFSFEKVARSKPGSYHDYWKHYHLSFNQEEGRASFREEINRIFSRNGIAFELGEDGQVRRLAPAVLGDALAKAIFRTGDAVLDELLETSRQKFLEPRPEVRQEALEKLWDAWERLKTLEHADKRTSVGMILDRASPEPNFRAVLENEATELTRIGNSFMIRHTEVGKTRIDSIEHIDFLFHRMFALIRILLRTTGRGG
jgi:hypothetical protein